jgi:hypothetical protein
MNGLAYTDDGGASWALSSLWDPFALAVYDLVRLPLGSAEEPPAGSSGRRLLASVDGPCCPERIWASDDDGATWAPLSALGPYSSRVLLAYVGETESGPETVFAVTTYSDVWRSGDGGRTWEEVGNIYPGEPTRVNDLVVGPDGRLYVAQNRAGSPVPSNGVYRTAAPVVVASEAGPEAMNASELAVYPNPSRSAAGGATVALTLAEPEEVRVAVYDVLGRAVAVLHEGPLAAGTARLALPAGVYIMRATVSEGGAPGGVRTFTNRLTLIE